MYIPEGEHAISPSVDGKPGDVVSRVSAERGPAIAAGLNAVLQDRLSKNVRPTFDFDHKDEGPASAIPKSFSYESGKGVMVEVEWTGAGKAAIEGKDYSYFSPVYLMDRNTGEPIGLPDAGPLGALVNEPAFREIERIAAKKAAPNQQPTSNMSVEALVKAGLISEAESKIDNVAELTATRLTEITAKAAKADTLEQEVTTLKASLQEVSKVSATAILESAISDGRIAAKDEATKDFWRDQLINAAANEEQLSKVKAALSAIKPFSTDVTKTEVKIDASNSKPQGDKQSRIEAAQAKATGELGATAGFQAIWDRANELDPTAFSEED